MTLFGVIYVTPPTTGPPDPFNWVWFTVLTCVILYNVAFGFRKGRRRWT